MAVPVIDPESSVLSYPQWLTWEHQFSATNTPYDWAIVAGNVPTGMSFQPSLGATGTSSGNLMNATAHGLPAGAVLVFRSKTGGSSLSTNTLYYVLAVDADHYQLAATPGGSALALGSDISAALVYRPGYLAGAATLPGISTVQLTATNGDGPSTPATLFTIGIEPAAAAPDSNIDLVWDFATNNIIAQSSSTLNLTPADPATPIIYVKEQDDLIVRLRLLKNGSVLSPNVTVCNLVLKELEPENQIIISDAFSGVGTGDAYSVLVHAKFNGVLLAASLSNYEADAGTFFPALAEIELTFDNPFAIGPGSLVRTSKTFRIQIDRDLGEVA